MQNYFFIIVLFIGLHHTHGKFARACQEKNSWRCGNGECIVADSFCDGITDCSDGSDETINNCFGITCPGYSFQCAYGACIPSKRKCDGRRDCHDNSDEYDWSCLRTDKELLDYERKLQGYCSDEHQFQCSSGECISGYDLCDGEANCEDGSDETTEYCTKFICPSFAFRCAYGACVSGKAKCNSVIDCFDRSDEVPAVCGYDIQFDNNTIYSYNVTSTYATTELPTSTSNATRPRDCIVPARRKALIVTDFVTNKQYGPGQSVSGNRTTVMLQCGNRKRLQGPNVGVCNDGTWVNGLSKCAKTEFCSNNKLLHPLSITANCFYDKQNISCSENLVRDTVVYASCSPGYTANKPGKDTVVAVCEQGGIWSEPIPKCRAICGIAMENGAQHYDPWFVSIFRKNIHDNYFFVCNGTIIAEQLVVTGAQCVADTDAYDEDEDFQPDDPALFAIVEGYYNLAFSDAAQTGRTVHNITRIQMVSDKAARYKRRYVGLLYLKDNFRFSTRVAPICLPNPRRMEQHIQYAPNFDVRIATPEQENQNNRAYLTSISVQSSQGEIIVISTENFMFEIKRLVRYFRNLY